MADGIRKTAARMPQSEKTVSMEIGPPRKSSADWLYPLRENGRKGGRLRFVKRRRDLGAAGESNGSLPADPATSNGSGGEIGAAGVEEP